MVKALDNEDEGFIVDWHMKIKVVPEDVRKLLYDFVMFFRSLKVYLPPDNMIIL